MKKTILLFGLLLGFGIAFSQNPFYTQDFGSGIPSGWTNSGHDKNAQTHANMWKYTTTGNHSPNGWPTTALASPTSSNGWIVFDSDSLDGQGNGVAPAPQRGYLTSTAISCTGHSRVLLQFYQLYFSLFGNPRVVVSNGTTADTIEVNADYNFTFGITPNPVKKQYDISTVAANQAAVTITFLWDDFKNGGYLFYWQVDDVSLIDAPANDLQIVQDGTFNFYSYPQSEVDSVYYYAFAANVGSATQTNARVAVQIKQNSSIVFTDTSALGVSLAPGIDTPALQGSNAYFPGAIANYTTYLSVFADSADGLPYNNLDTAHFVVSDSVFAADNGVYGGSFALHLTPAFSSSGTAVSQELANIFYLANPDTITSVTAAFDAIFSTAGASVQANIYSLPANFAGYGVSYACTPVIQTEQKVLSQAQLTAPNTGGAIHVVPVNFQISNSTGVAKAAILQPGYYAVSLTNVNDSLLSLVNSFAGAGIAGTPGGIISGGSINAYSNTHFYVRPNFGHNFNLLQAAFTRTPGINPIKVGQTVTFRGNTNNTGDANTTYAWSFTSIDSNYTVASNYYTGQNITYAFPLADVVNVCLTVTDNGQTAQACSSVTVRDLGVGIQEVTLGNLSIMPNPTTGHVNITAENAEGTVSTTVTDMLGNVVKTYNDQSNGTFSKSYDLSNLAGGVYVVKIENNGTVVTKKLSLNK